MKTTHQPVESAAHEYAGSVQTFIEESKARSGRLQAAAYMGFTDGLAAALADPAWARAVLLQESDRKGGDVAKIRAERRVALWTVVEKYSQRCA